MFTKTEEDNFDQIFNCVWITTIQFFCIGSHLKFISIYLVTENKLNLIFLDTKFNLFSVTRYIETNYPYDCFAVTMYQSLLMALVSLLTFLCTLKTRIWISKCNCKSKYTNLWRNWCQDSKRWLLMSETQQLIMLTY